MSITAKLNYLHIAPRKVRLVADLIRGKSVEKAQTILNFTDKRAGVPLLKLLNSAIANAKNNFQIEDAANLYISKLLVNEGPKYKRWRPVSRGRAYEIRKRTSHIILVLDEIGKKETKAKAKKKILPKAAIKELPEEKTEAKKEEKERYKARERKTRPKFESADWRKKPKDAAGLKRVFRRKAF